MLYEFADLTTYAPPSSPDSPPPAQVVPESGDGAASSLPDLNDVIDALFDHDVDDTVHVSQQNMFDHGEVVNISMNRQSLVAVASSADVLLSTEANFSAIDTLVDAIRPTIVNNVLLRAVLLPDIATTQRCVADEVLVLVALLVEASNVTATVEEVLKLL